MLILNFSCVKIKVPNQLNISIRGNFFFIGIVIFSYTCPYTEFDKNASSDNMDVLIALYIELVWRLSEFAFFVRLLR